MDEMERLKIKNAELKQQLENQRKKNGPWALLDWKLKVSIFCIVVSLICIAINGIKILRL